MKAKPTTAGEFSGADSKYIKLIDEYLRRIQEARTEMEQSKSEIARLKSASRRKLAQIDAILKAC